MIRKQTTRSQRVPTMPSAIKYDQFGKITLIFYDGVRGWVMVCRPGGNPFLNTRAEWDLLSDVPVVKRSIR